LLAVLLVHVNQVISTDRLIDELWGGQPPQAALNVVQTYVSRLRKVFRGPGAGTGDVLLSHPPGYVLRVGPEELDVQVFEDRVREARSRLDSDPAAASRLLTQALGLWRSSPLADFADEAFAQTEIGRLEELRAAAIEDRVEADLAVGRHAALAGELDGLVAAYPLRERLRGQRILALYRSGRQAEALQVYAETRRVLAEEFGIDPSPALQRLGNAILHQDPGLELAPLPARAARQAAEAAAEAGHAGPPTQAATRAGNGAAEELGLLDLGEPRPEDLLNSQRLVDPELPSRVPPVRTLENRPTNLPVQPTPFVGRDREVNDVIELLHRDDVRLLTLAGPGGTGKTRLALQGAAEVVEGFGDGIFFVALAPILDPALVLASIAEVLGVSEAAGQSFVAFLVGKELLLVLDNFEQVITAAAQLAGLLALAPKIKVLVTSREPLHIAAEHVYPVPPLQVPDLRHIDEPSALLRFEAVTLFVKRAQALQPGFEVTAVNARAIAQICVRLDGLPLALELAAARTPLLPPEAMQKRLGERLKLLRSVGRDLPERHQTLRGTLAWSHDLLAEAERTLFARLAVFVGGFTLDAAETVCDADLDAVASLLDKSLLRRDGERFEMLETIREFAVERLAAGGDESHVRTRHAAFFAAIAERAHRERFEREGELLLALERDHDNLRAAIDWLGEHDSKRCLGLVGALGWFWHLHSHFAEGRARLTQALAGRTERDEFRARALSAAGELAAWAGDIPAAAPLVEEAVSIWHELGVEREAALALHELGWGYFFTGDDLAARRCMEESLALQQRHGTPILVNRAQIGLLQVLVSIGELATVERLSREALELAARLGDQRSRHFAYHFLADCALIQGDCMVAQERYRRSLELAVGLGDRFEIATEIQGLAMAAAGLSQRRRAVRLEGAAAAVLDSLGVDWSGTHFWDRLMDQYIGQARAELGDDAPRVSEEGTRLELDRAIEEALSIEVPPYVG
jgi:predicted ATPase/DNA-binding SARP family transcriptional activator